MHWLLLAWDNSPQTKYMTRLGTELSASNHLDGMQNVGALLVNHTTAG